MGDQAREHRSGSSYEMLAFYVKGKRRILGKNKLSRPAYRMHSVYPEIHGQHAELDVWVQAAKADIFLRGGTLYIVGVTKSRNKNIMSNTGPCKHCRFVLRENTNISSLVYYKGGKLIKEIWR